MRNLFVGLTAAVALSLASGVARAEQIQVTYNLVPSQSGTAAPNTSHFDATSPTAIPNLAPITGTVVITFTGDGSGNIANGPVTVQSLVANTNLGAAGFGGAQIGLGGIVTSSLVAPVTSTATGGSIAPVVGTIHLSGTVTCNPLMFCGLLGVPASTTLNQDVTVMIGGSGTTGNPATFSATQPLTLALGSFNSSGNAILFGTETGRTIVPEPGTLLLLGAGLGGLVLIGRRRDS